MYLTMRSPSRDTSPVDEMLVMLAIIYMLRVHPLLEGKLPLRPPLPPPPGKLCLMTT